MSLPSSGPISLSNLATEFGGTPPHSLSEYYRGGIYVPNSPQNYPIPTNGPMSMNMFYGSTNRIFINILLSSNAQNIDLINLVGSTYSAGISDIVVTIDSGIVIGSSSTSTYAMYVRNFTSGDSITMNINGGYIVGKGGVGGNGGYYTGNNPGTDGQNGGNSLLVEFPITITNNGIIGGGGGGAGGGASYYGGNPDLYTAASGSGGGGGAGSVVGVGGTGGPGGRYAGPSDDGSSGGLTDGGTGGHAWHNTGPNYNYYAGTGGIGGSLGGAGAAGGTCSRGDTSAGGAGGAAGKAVVGDSFITWETLGDIRGARI